MQIVDVTPRIMLGNISIMDTRPDALPAVDSMAITWGGDSWNEQPPASTLTLIILDRSGRLRDVASDPAQLRALTVEISIPYPSAETGRLTLFRGRVTEMDLEEQGGEWRAQIAATSDAAKLANTVVQKNAWLASGVWADGDTLGFRVSSIGVGMTEAGITGTISDISRNDTHPGSQYEIAGKTFAEALQILYNSVGQVGYYFVPGKADGWGTYRALLDESNITPFSYPSAWANTPMTVKDRNNRLVISAVSDWNAQQGASGIAIDGTKAHTDRIGLRFTTEQTVEAGALQPDGDKANVVKATTAAQYLVLDTMLKATATGGGRLWEYVKYTLDPLIARFSGSIRPEPISVPLGKRLAEDLIDALLRPWPHGAPVYVSSFRAWNAVYSQSQTPRAPVFSAVGGTLSYSGATGWTHTLTLIGNAARGGAYSKILPVTWQSMKTAIRWDNPTAANPAYHPGVSWQEVHYARPY